MPFVKNSSKGIRLINISIRTKLLLIYLLCVLIPIMVFSSAFYLSVMNNLKKEKLILYGQALDRIAATVSTNAMSAVEVSNVIYPDLAMYRFINGTYADKKQALEKYDEYLKGAWKKILPYNTSIVLLSIHTTNDSLLNSDNLRVIDSNIEKSDWYQEYKKTDSKAKFINHVDELIVGAAKVKLFSYFRILDYISNQEYKHFLKVTFQPDMFDKILKTEKIPGDIYIVDHDGYIVAQTNKKHELYNKSDYTPFDLINTDDDHIILNSRIKAMNDWQVICILNKDFMSEESNKSILQIFGLISFVTIFASVIIWVISSSLYKRIDILVDHMGKVENGEYTLIDENKKGGDEIGLLITSMNKMIIRLNVLIENVYKAKIKETQLELSQKQAELKALQWQVNPHFMFNVLETIRIKSFLNNEFETARIIKYMSKIFRKLLLWKDDLIEVREELDFINEYLEIQQYRYEDELEFEITADEESLSFKIPKMTLQTFVDNACEHGFSEKMGLKKVNVSVKTYGEFIELRVYDNGKGMADTLPDSTVSHDSKSIGIKNVIGRLDLYYGENYKFNINSHLGEYTEIIITIITAGLDG